MNKLKQNKKIYIVSLIIVLVALAIVITVTKNRTPQKKPQDKIHKQEINIIENRPEEQVFLFTIEEFIDSYNKYAEKKYKIHVPNIAAWSTVEYEKGIHSNYETKYSYCEMKDNGKLELPRFGIYTPTNSNYIQEITIKLDYHSFSEIKYELYEEMCYYTLKIFFPDVEDQKIIETYKTLNTLADENVYPQSKKYSNGAIPYALYHKNGIGIYSYFAIGDNLRLCIIPVNTKTIQELKAKGTKVYEI